jgi:hypothetical protein
METFGQRITRIICDEETARNRCVVLPGLAERLAVYLTGADRTRFLAEASTGIGEPVTDLLDAFLYLLPVDMHVIPGWREDQPAIRLKPWRKSFGALS